MAGNDKSGRKKGKGLSPKVQDEIRSKIDGAKIVNSLMEHIKGESKMESTQVTAGLGLLKKMLPDLQATQLSNDPENPITPVISSKPLSKKEWDEQYASDMGSTEGPAGISS